MRRSPSPFITSTHFWFSRFSPAGISLNNYRLFRDLIQEDNCCSPKTVKHPEAHARLARVGFERVIGYLPADEARWREANIPLASIPTHRCGDVQRALAADPSLQLVDVRSRAEWLRGHLPGAVSMPLLEFESSAQLINRSKPSIVYCHAGFRASTAVSILLRESSNDIGVFLDGFEGWSALGLPLEVPNTR